MSKLIVNRVLASVAAALLAVVLAHGCGLLNGFVWDDHYYVVQNAGIRSWANLPAHFYAPDRFMGELDTQIWRPLRNLTYSLDYSLWKLNSFGYHLSNLLLHALNTVLLFLLVRKLAEHVTPATVAALLFAVHPVLTEAVGWIKGRDDLLALTFFLSALLVFVRSNSLRASPARPWLFLLFLVCALLSKEAALCLVPMAALLCMVQKKRGRGASLAAESGRVLTLGFVLTLLYLLLRRLVLGRVSQTDWITGSALTTLLTMVPVLARYVRLALFPVGLSCDYSDFPVVESAFDPVFLLSLLLIVLILLAVRRLWRRWELVSFGFCWFFLNLLPVSNLVPTMQFMAERFLYLPMAGFCLAVGCGFARFDQSLARRRRLRGALRVCSAAVLLLLCAGSVMRTRDWRDDASVFEAALRVSPGNVRVRDQAATAAINRGDHGRVVELLGDVVDATTGSAKAMRNLGCALFAAGRHAEAVSLLEAAVRRDPAFAQPHEDLGRMALRQADPEQAVRRFAAAVKREPLNDRRWMNLGLACRQAGEMDRSRRAFETAVNLNPTAVNALRALASLHWQQDHRDVAATYFERILTLIPDDADALYWREQARAQSLDTPPPPAHSTEPSTTNH